MWPIRSILCCSPPMSRSPCPERIARQANKVGLYNALSFGDIMLQGALQKK